MRKILSRWAGDVEGIRELVAATEPQAGEEWLVDFAARHGLVAVRLIPSLRSRLGKTLGRRSSASVEELAESGAMRKLGKKWVLNTSMCEELLDSPAYDPTVEATLNELLTELGAFSNTAALNKVLRSAGVPARYVISPTGGRSAQVFDRDAAMVAVAERRRRRRVTSSTRGLAPEGATQVLRDRVGPFVLSAETPRESVTPADAAWLCGIEESELMAQAKHDVASRVPGASGRHIAIGWLEQRLVDEGDLEGLRLLAGLLDGRLCGGPGIDRVAALLQLD